MYCSMFFALLFNKIFDVAFFDFSTVSSSTQLLVWNTTVMHRSEFYVDLLLFNNTAIASHKHEASEKQQSIKKR